jgi:acetolactate synthase-1/3 small subunit
MENKKQILTLVMENETGALARITDVFTARGYSIENINAGTINYKNNTSSITITLFETEERIKKLILQLQRIIPVVSIKNITENNVSKELVLVNIKKNKDVDKIIKKYSAKEINENIIELVAIQEIIDEFIKDLNEFGIDNIVRTGILAIENSI